MKFNASALALAATLALSTVLSVPAFAQRHGTASQRAENTQAASALRARIDMTEGRVAEGLREGRISSARAIAMRRRVAQTRSSVIRLSRQQGFVSAAELASYNRTLGALDIELDRRGVARSYGNDGLVALPHGMAPATVRPSPH